MPRFLTTAWIFPTFEAAEAAVAAYRGDAKYPDPEWGRELMRQHGGKVYDPENPPAEGWLFSITELKGGKEGA